MFLKKTSHTWNHGMISSRYNLTLASKCTVVVISKKKSPLLRDYTLCGQVLERKGSQQHMGVILDSYLTYEDQVDNTVAASQRTSVFLRRNIWSCPKEVND